MPDTTIESRTYRATLVDQLTRKFAPGGRVFGPALVTFRLLQGEPTTRPYVSVAIDGEHAYGYCGVEASIADEVAGARRCGIILHSEVAGDDVEADAIDAYFAGADTPIVDVPSCRWCDEPVAPGRFAALDTCEQHSIPGHVKRVVVFVGWDGRSNPILRYRDELHLPDHRRSSVAPQDR